MDALFWQRLHGGSTHLPLSLLLVSVGLDFVAVRIRNQESRRGLHGAGLACAIVGILGGCGAIASGLAMTHGEMIGRDLEKLHHLFVWPAFALCLGLVLCRLLQRRGRSHAAFKYYLVAMTAGSVLMMIAGYWGGEMILHSEINSVATTAAAEATNVLVTGGQRLFLMNCAHCHGDDARGTDEAPNLTNVRKSDARIATLIQNGIKGEMPRFGQKLHDEDVRQLIAFLHSLRANGNQASIGTPRNRP